ncbi:hypothetical protein FRB94_013017 [Tulasnella sp. JGI-2019a]|nr:hypothetical protein FRB94_013017 [Tulasnella sp. JGI-2019a]
MGDALDVVRLSLTALSIGLRASPIPEPFKAAVSGIPEVVLQIIAIVEAVKGNTDDARDLALYIGKVTETAVRPLQGMPSDFSHPPLEEGLDAFRETLKLVREEINALLTLSRAARILHYRSNAIKVATMKQRVRDAITCIQASVPQMYRRSPFAEFTQYYSLRLLLPPLTDSAKLARSKRLAGAFSFP